MEIKSATIVFFSPTGTTRKVISSFVQGMNIDNIQIIDLFSSEEREKLKLTVQSDILIIGLPVYGQRIPKFLYPFLTSIEGNNKPAVLITVYGNISPGQALEELYAITKRRNMRIIALGKFIGEHSFSTPTLPLAIGRPNQADLFEAQQFGKLTGEKLIAAQGIDDAELKLTKPLIIGNMIRFLSAIFPQKGGNVFTKLPKVNINRCQKCGICVQSCPMQVIDPNELLIRRDLCIRCFSCVKKCPSGARETKFKKRVIVAWFLNKKGKFSKKPEYIL